MIFHEDEFGSSLIFDTDEEYLQLAFAAHEIFRFKGKTKKTVDKYINKYINLALREYIEKLNEEQRS
jgi:hypothetical protein